MLRTKLARKLLTKKEQKHLTEVAAIHTMAAMKRQANFMKGDEFACFKCKQIATKLGLYKEKEGRKS